MDPQMRARVHEGGYDSDDLLRNQNRHNDAYWHSQGHPPVLHTDPQQISQDSSLQGAVTTNLEAVATRPPAPNASLSWVPLLCMPYERGRGNHAEHQNVVYFKRPGSEGVLLAELLGKRSMPDLVDGDRAGLPNDVAAKISIRIEFPGCVPYTRQIMSRRSTSTGEPILLISLGHKIAAEMRKFMEMTTEAHKPLMHDGIVLEMKDLLLCRLTRASSGSWVPEFKVPHWNLRE
ncbi:hypothetical protein C8Q74DRAFT_43821 [Fomes fomentarius]|nr:hypothetical protein C8Q74DRAFT_43821 [Fomes fomentarius]